uniref:Lectin-1 n=1 Tax=Hypnea cervicornis TaxID=387623 RepID=LEC1_HYPCE|nr:RecName: Full=Lectin-1; AltName: Full=HCA; Contains: RecName: Full=Lectin-1 N-terminal subunit; Contains: RecName: Full=Lectin-1 C-terminal subunit [Hypnea cervicornis]
QKACTMDYFPVCCQIVLGGGAYTAGNPCSCQGFVASKGTCDNPYPCPCTTEAQFPVCCTTQWGLVSATGNCACGCMGGVPVSDGPCPEVY